MFLFQTADSYGLFQFLRITAPMNNKSINLDQDEPFKEKLFYKEKVMVNQNRKLFKTKQQKPDGYQMKKGLQFWGLSGAEQAQ